jgi:hypothetical protein
MALWNVKFDHKNGETRRCKRCDTDFHTTKPRWYCKTCVGKINHEAAKKKYGEGVPATGRWAGLPLKKPYPFNNRTTAASNRFCTIRTALSKAWKEYSKTGDKSVVIAHYDKQLKEIEENGIMEWILDRRCDAYRKETQVKSKKMISNEYPDTRGYHED